MVYLGSALKEDIVLLAEEMSLTVSLEMTKLDLRKLITSSPEYDEGFAKNSLSVIVEERKRRIEDVRWQEKKERWRQEDARWQEQKERWRQEDAEKKERYRQEDAGKGKRRWQEEIKERRRQEEKEMKRLLELEKMKKELEIRKMERQLELEEMEKRKKELDKRELELEKTKKELEEKVIRKQSGNEHREESDDETEAIGMEEEETEALSEETEEPAAAPSGRGKRRIAVPKYSEDSGFENDTQKDDVGSEEEKPAKKHGEQPAKSEVKVIPAKRRGKEGSGSEEKSPEEKAPKKRGRKTEKKTPATPTRRGGREMKSTKSTENYGSSEVEDDQPSEKEATWDFQCQLWCFKGGTLTDATTWMMPTTTGKTAADMMKSWTN